MDLVAHKAQEYQLPKVDSQQELVLASQEIQSALTILENAQNADQSYAQLTEKIYLANQIVAKVTQRLQNLEAKLKLLKTPENSAQISQEQEVQKVIAKKVEDIRQTVNLLQYTA